MAEKFVYAQGFYAGIPCLMGQFTLSHGAKASAATVYFLRNQVLPSYGDLVIDGVDEFGNNHTITFPNCFADNIQANAGGDPTILVRILDRRWAWGFAAISGHYNIRSESGDSIFNEKTPREMAKLCLEVIGESNADLGNFDPAGRPPVDWEIVNPARALEELVSQFGYRIVLGVDNRVHICRDGEGDISALSRYTWLEDTIGIDFPKRPDGVIAESGRNLYNMDLWLEPVLPDTNGEWKYYEDVSYKPTAGWESTAPPFIASTIQYPPNVSKQEIQKLITEHLYRTYRISIRKPDHWGGYGEYMSIFGYNMKGMKTLVGRWQVLPLEPSQNLPAMTEVGVAPNTLLAPKRKAPEVFGYFNSGGAGKEDLFTDNNKYRIYKRGYAIDFERGFVHFTDIAHLIDSNNKMKPARLFLRIASGVRDEKTRAWKRHSIEQRFSPSLGAGMMVSLHDEIQLRYSPIYNSETLVPFLVAGKNNKNDVERELKYYLNATIATLEQRAARTGSFAGILNIEPSGLVQQITWSWGSDGPKTQFSANTEHNYNVPTYYERRLLSKLQDDKKKLAASGAGGTQKTPQNGAPA